MEQEIDSYTVAQALARNPEFTPVLNMPEFFWAALGVAACPCPSVLSWLTEATLVDCSRVQGSPVKSKVFAFEGEVFFLHENRRGLRGPRLQILNYGVFATFALLVFKAHLVKVSKNNPAVDKAVCPVISDGPYLSRRRSINRT